MRNGCRIGVIIPALNEELSIGHVLDAIPAWVDEVVVADNGSTDKTPGVAEAHGAKVVHELRRGYGSACLKGIAALEKPGVVVFLDGDFSDHPEEMGQLVDPIVVGETDLVIGSRVLGQREAGALTPQARFGNWLATGLIRLFWGTRYTDLGPFRGIRYSALRRLRMADPDFGWTVEMQIKAAILGIRSREVPVSYRKRIGKSKISGTVRGVVLAGTKILGTIFSAAWKERRSGAAQDAAERVVVFTRYPVPGETKTRLIPALGEEGAAQLQREMTEHTMRTVDALCRERAASVEVRFTGGEGQTMHDWLGDRVFKRQGDGDLGDRMARSLKDAFTQNCGRVIVIGTDCPSITTGTLSDALNALAMHDLVIGPATDGGYYLIGLRQDVAGIALPDLFNGPTWGTGDVLDKTQGIARALGLSVLLLPSLTDVDEPGDLGEWE